MTATTPTVRLPLNGTSMTLGANGPAYAYGRAPGIRRGAAPTMPESITAFEAAYGTLLRACTAAIAGPDPTIADENYNSERLLRIWDDYVHGPGRRKGEQVWTERGWTVDTLKHFGAKRVFEACLGSGLEGVHMAQHGLDVTGNDLDASFIRMALANAHRAGETLQTTQHDWRHLYRHVPAGSFDAVTCTGNSLTYVFGAQQQLLALANFYHMLPEGGVLVIDERNYEYILTHRREILDDHNFRFSKKVLYCGPKVHGHPAEITDQYVLMQYDHEDYPGEPGYLKLYPFRAGELMGLLMRTGFRKVYQFSDYRPGYDTGADFHHYVCVK